MLTEHFAPTGLGRCGLAMAINISLLTEFSYVSSDRKFPNSTAVLSRGEGETFPALEKFCRWASFYRAAIGGSLS